MEWRLIRDGFRLIVPNRPGYYGTSLECGRSAASCADLAAGILNTLGIERVAVIATSGGGPGALCFSVRYPERVVALVMQCAQAHRWDDKRWLPAGMEGLLPWIGKSWLRRLVNELHILDERSLRVFPRKNLRRMCGSRFAEVCDDAEVEELNTRIVESTLHCLAQPAGIKNDLEILLSDGWQASERVRRPTLVIHDDADPVVPVGHAAWAVQQIRGAQRCDVHAGGHLIWVGRDAARMHSSRVAFLRQHFARMG
jgi:pimeloyl-ACP methyl ester carboxylesterase